MKRATTDYKAVSAPGGVAVVMSSYTLAVSECSANPVRLFLDST